VTQDVHLATDLEYFDSATIWCKDGTKSFPRERLNDNFCDCADGTDEPGTSACLEGKFYCKDTGITPRRVFSSRVNDGICGETLISLSISQIELSAHEIRII
jgi:hypothetical protein